MKKILLLVMVLLLSGCNSKEEIKFHYNPEHYYVKVNDQQEDYLGYGMFRVDWDLGGYRYVREINEDGSEIRIGVYQDVNVIVYKSEEVKYDGYFKVTNDGDTLVLYDSNGEYSQQITFPNLDDLYTEEDMFNFAESSIKQFIKFNFFESDDGRICFPSINVNLCFEDIDDYLGNVWMESNIKWREE